MSSKCLNFLIMIPLCYVCITSQYQSAHYLYFSQPLTEQAAAQVHKL